MAKKLTQKQLEKHLENLSKEELIAEIGKLFKRFQEVQAFYQMEYGEKADREAILKSCKDKIYQQFYSPAVATHVSRRHRSCERLSATSKRSQFSNLSWLT